MRPRTSLVAAGLALSLTSCANLVLRDEDSGWKKAVKVTARVILVAPTFGGSERRVRRYTRRYRFDRELDRGIGKMTYDDAVIRFGRPDHLTWGTEAVAAKWTQKIGGTLYGGSRRTHGAELRLTFDAESRLMTTWTYKEW